MLPGSVASSTKTTVLKFSQSLITRQPVPDRYFTWLRITNAGRYNATSAAANSFAFSIDQIINPHSYIGGSSAGLPNPEVALNANNCTMARNLLYNSGTSTGIWELFRPWRAKVKLTMLSQNTGDAPQIAMAPIIGTTATYSTANAIAQAPNSCMLLATAAGTSASTSLSGNYSFPELAGVPESLYAGNSTYSLAYNSTPNFYLQAGYFNTSGAALLGNLNILVEVMVFVEFYSRVDVFAKQ